MPRRKGGERDKDKDEEGKKKNECLKNVFGRCVND
jgi:hypothetical protein